MKLSTRVVSGLASIAASSLVGISLAQSTFYVADYGSDLDTGADWGHSLATISNALSRASSGDTVKVLAGTYDLYEEVLIDKAVTVIAEGGRDETILQRASNAPDLVRVAHLTDPGAVLAGFTLRNGSMGRTENIDEFKSGAGVLIEHGTVTNCVIRDNIGGTNHGGNYVRGVGVALWNDGLLVDSEICGNGTNSTFQAGGGVFMTGGTIRRCFIHDNFAGSNSTWQKGLDGGGGIYMSAGTVENCLVTGNSTLNYHGGGILMDGGELVNCTISANRIREGGSANGGGINRRYGGSIRNCIVYGNMNSSGMPNNIIGGAAYATYTCSPDLSASNGNMASAPLFLDTANGDYRLAANSPCIDAGSTVEDADFDLAMNARVFDGNNDGNPVIDLGCYEFFRSADAFDCIFETRGSASGFAPLEVFFDATSFGSQAATADVFLSWDFGDGSDPLDTGSTTSASYTFNDVGSYTVSLTVTNLFGDSATFSRPACVSVFGSTVYVATNGAAVYPYATPANAATDIAVAMSAANAIIAAGAPSATVEVGPGDYTISAEVQLSSAIRFVGTEGPAVTRVTQASNDTRAMSVTHADAVISGITIDGSFVSTDRQGGGVKMTAGTVTNCVVTGCTGGGHGIGPMYGAVYLGGPALLVDSVVTSNRYDYNGAPVWIENSAAVVDRCEISYNRGSMQNHSGDGGGGVRLNGGTVRNCLIHHNETIYHPGGGVRVYSGTLENCTIVDNIAGPAGAGGVHHSGGTVLNCIVSRNLDSQSAPSDYVGSTATYTCAPELVTGTGNTTSEPLFVDAENGDYRLKASSPCVDAGAPDTDAGDFDFSLARRVQDGDGDGTPVIDMGCFEYFRDLSVFDVAFAATTPVAAIDSLEAEFSTTVYGGTDSTARVYCEWDFGDGSDHVAEWDLFEISHEYTAPGSYDVTLYARSAIGETVEFSRPAYIRVLSDHAYVATNGVPAYPYATPDTAASDIVAARNAIVEALGLGAESGTISIGPGEYSISSEIALDNAIAVSGAGRDLTVVRQITDNQRGFVLTHADATLTSLSVIGGYTPNNRRGGGVYLSAGMATNIVVTGCRGGGHGIGGLQGSVYVGGTGTLVDSLVVSNRYSYNGAAVWLESTYALVDRCEIAWNQGSMQYHSGDGGGGLRVNGGIARNCLIHHNESLFHNGGGVRIYNGTLENCTIVDNFVDQDDVGYGGGVFHQGGTVRNCIVARNACNGTPGDYIRNGTPPCLNNCAPELAEAGDGNIADEPLFKDADNGDYRVFPNSPTVGAGLDQDWMANALDLAHELRHLGAHVDIGCYETRLQGTVIFVK